MAVDDSRSVGAGEHVALTFRNKCSENDRLSAQRDFLSVAQNARILQSTLLIRGRVETLEPTKSIVKLNKCPSPSATNK